MLTFTATGPGSLRCTGGPKSFTVFPAKEAKDDLVLLPSPEEEPHKGIVSWPGEYDVAGITIRGIGHEEGQRVSYMVEVDGVRVAFPSSPLNTWPEEDIELLGDIHVLVLPGDADAKVVQTLLDEVDPRVLFLLAGKDGKIHAELLKLAGAVGKEAVKEFKLKGSFAAEGREVVVFG